MGETKRRKTPLFKEKKRRKTPTPKTSNSAATGESPPVGPEIEFRNTEDDAWYNVQIVLLNETLLVKFKEFSDDHDLKFHADDFKNSDEIFEFRRRFRPLSLQFEASDCFLVKVGMKVCALVVSVICPNDLRFYDAIVEAVKREEHTFVDGIEQCSCTVVLSWLHGPKAGTLTAARVEDLCPPQPHKHLDPRVASFLERAKWKHEKASPCSKLFTEDITCKGESPTSFKSKPWSSIQKSEGGRHIGSAVHCDEGYIGYETNEDVDLGGGGGGGDSDHAKRRKNDEDDDDFFSLEKLVEDVCGIGLGGGKVNGETRIADIESRYFIVVENMEKDLSRSTIVDFVLEETGLKIEAYVFLSLSSEPYTRGALVVDCVEDLEKLYDFLVKPEQMITSSKGRPWIVSESSATESVRPSFWCLEKDVKELSAGDGLRVVRLGSEEYKKAMKLKDLYFEFTVHQQQLFKRFALEEQQILDA